MPYRHACVTSVYRGRLYPCVKTIAVVTGYGIAGGGTRPDRRWLSARSSGLRWTVRDIPRRIRRTHGRGSPSLAKGGGLKTRSRRGPWVRIPSLASDSVLSGTDSRIVERLERIRHHCQFPSRSSMGRRRNTTVSAGGRFNDALLTSGARARGRTVTLGPRSVTRCYSVVSASRKTTPIARRNSSKASRLDISFSSANSTVETSRGTLKYPFRTALCRSSRCVSDRSNGALWFDGMRVHQPCGSAQSRAIDARMDLWPPEG